MLHYHWAPSQIKPVDYARITSWVFAGCAAIVVLVVIVWTVRRSPRPPRALIGSGIGALILAGVYVTLWATLHPKYHVGLWSPDLVASVPTLLAAVGATAASVWVAIWAADHARISSFVASEAALIYELTGILRSLQRQLSEFRALWLGPEAVAVSCGDKILEDFRLLVPNSGTGSTALFGDGGIADHGVGSTLTTVLGQRLQDLPPLEDIVRRMRDLEVRTGLPMGELLADVAFAHSLAEGNQVVSPDGGRLAGSAQASNATADMQLLAIMAAGVQGSVSVQAPGGTAGNESSEDGAGADVEAGWRDVVRLRTHRSEKLQRELRSRVGSSPPTAFEALAFFSPNHAAWIELRWSRFVRAQEARAALLLSLTAANPELTPPSPFSAASHSALWQSIATDAGLRQ